MSKWSNACEAYWWVYNHPELLYKGCINPWIEVTPHMVDPELGEGGGMINREDPTRNLKMQFWIEAGPYTECDIYNNGDLTLLVSHDYDLDCGGWTWEEAVLDLAQKVLEKYGDY